MYFRANAFFLALALSFFGTLMLFSRSLLFLAFDFMSFS